jgi:hypothetical protein
MTGKNQSDESPRTPANEVVLRIDASLRRCDNPAVRGFCLRRYGTAAAAVAAASLFLAAGGGAAGSTIYSSATIPPNLDFGAISVSQSGLVLSGSTSLDGDQGVACLTARVDPRTLALFGLVEPLCSDTPLLTGQSVAVTETEATTMVVSVRIAHLAPSGHVEIGPVVVTYTELSDTHLETVRASGSLWLYAPDTPSGGRALRISETTGQVLQDTPVSPAMDRPIIAANANGLYLAPASNTGFLGTGRAPHENGIIYRVGIDASAVQVFDAASASPFPGSVSWIAGDGNSLWADICHRPVATACVITRFNGSSAKPVFQVSDHKMTGYWVVGNVSQGFYGVVPSSYSGSQATGSEEVIRIDPASGAVEAIAAIPLPEFWQGNFFSGSSEATLFGDALYLLVPPGSTASSSPGALYRVPLPEDS